jgi:hypothetical protein
MAHAAAPFGSLPGWRADAGLPADLGQAGPELVAERAELRSVFENGYWHEMIMPSRAVSQSCLIGAAEVAGTREYQDDLQPSPAATWTVSTRRPQAVGNSLLLFA